MKKFKEGSLVCLKIGGPLMTVEKISLQEEIVNTVWFVDGKVFRDAFHHSHLNLFRMEE